MIFAMLIRHYCILLPRYATLRSMILLCRYAFAVFALDAIIMPCHIIFALLPRRYYDMFFERYAIMFRCLAAY